MSPKPAKKPAKKRPLRPVEARYWRFWERYAAFKGVPRGSRPARMGLHTHALGHPRSLTAFEDHDFDMVFAAIVFALNGWPFDAVAWAQKATEGSRRRKVYRCLLEAPAVYLAKLSEGKFGTREWHELGLPELEQLRITVIERARQHRRRHGNKASLYDRLQPPRKEDPF